MQPPITVPLAVDESPEPRVVLLPQVVEARPDEELVERVHALQHVHPIRLSGLWDETDIKRHHSKQWLSSADFNESHATS